MCLLSLFVLGVPLTSSFSAPPSRFKISITIPQESLDLSDLDVRDELNRPVRSIQAVQQIKNLFAANLKDLLLENLTITKRRMYSILAQTWDLFSGWFRRAHNFVSSTVDSWIRHKKSFFKLAVLHGSFSSIYTNGLAYWPASEINRFSFLYLLSSIISSTHLRK